MKTMRGVEGLLYVDTSALLPYYRREALSEEVDMMLQSAPGRIVISHLTEVEVFSALARWQRMGELTEIDVQRIQDMFETHRTQSFYLLLPLLDTIFQQAKEWLSRRDTALRTLDALHLACAHDCGAELVSADDKLIRAARVLGIRCRYLYG